MSSERLSEFLTLDSSDPVFKFKCLEFIDFIQSQLEFIPPHSLEYNEFLVLCDSFLSKEPTISLSLLKPSSCSSQSSYALGCILLNLSTKYPSIWLENSVLSASISRLPDLFSKFSLSPFSNHPDFITTKASFSSLLNCLLPFLEDNTNNLCNSSVNFISNLVFLRGYSKFLCNFLAQNFCITLFEKLVLFSNFSTKFILLLFPLVLNHFPQYFLPFELIVKADLTCLLSESNFKLDNIPMLFSFLFKDIFNLIKSQNDLFISELSKILGILSQYLTRNFDCNSHETLFFCIILISCIYFSLAPVSDDVTGSIMQMIGFILSITDDSGRNQVVLLIKALDYHHSKMKESSKNSSEFIDFEHNLNEQEQTIIVKCFKIAELENISMLLFKNEAEEDQEEPNFYSKFPITTPLNNSLENSFDLSSLSVIPREIGKRNSTLRECLALLSSDKYDDWYHGFSQLPNRITEFSSFLVSNLALSREISKRILSVENQFAEVSFFPTISNTLVNLIIASPKTIKYLVEFGLENDASTSKKVVVLNSLTRAVNILALESINKQTATNEFKLRPINLNNHVEIPEKAKKNIDARLKEKTKILSKGHVINDLAIKSRLFQSFDDFFFPVYNYFSANFSLFLSCFSDFQSPDSVHYSHILASLFGFLGTFCSNISLNPKTLTLFQNSLKLIITVQDKISKNCNKYLKRSVYACSALLLGSICTETDLLQLFDDISTLQKFQGLLISGLDDVDNQISNCAKTALGILQERIHDHLIT
ncbi:hypothetical protein RCL1_002169 [Eukaryota sp. TZLM3-RCL]